MTNEELKKSLLAAPKSGFARLSAQERTELESHAAGYAAFIDVCKTEREAVAWAVEQLKNNGFVELVPGMALKPGDKVYRNNRGKALMMAVIGSESMNTGARICAAHIDSPRLDLKPNPLYEEVDFALFKIKIGNLEGHCLADPDAGHGQEAREERPLVLLHPVAHRAELIALEELILNFLAGRGLRPALEPLHKILAFHIFLRIAPADESFHMAELFIFPGRVLIERVEGLDDPAGSEVLHERAAAEGSLDLNEMHLVLQTGRCLKAG